MAKSPQEVEKRNTRIKASLKYSGPLPHPAIMEGYQQIDPSLPPQIMDEFHKNSEHTRQQERDLMRAEINDTKRAQYMALTVALALLGIVALSIVYDSFIFAGGSGLAFLVLMANAFLQRKK